MGSRLTTQALADLLTEHTGKDRKSTELFLRELVAAISEGVFTDKIVKVKGLGTFKVVLMEERESIHVNTGERFTIPEHYKFAFLPDKELREAVNKPFSFFETEELADDSDHAESDAQKDEEEPLLYDTNEATDMKEPAEEGRTGVSHFVRTLVVAGIAALIAVVSFLLYENRDFFPGLRQSEPSVLVGSSLPGSAVVPTDTIQTETAEVQDTVAVEAVEEPRSESKVMAMVKIQPGSRLTLISLEYYGSKICWVYLYEFNRQTIKDPNSIPVGTEILVPAPEVYGIDRHNPTSTRKAATRQAEILSGDL